MFHYQQCRVLFIAAIEPVVDNCFFGDIFARFSFLMRVSFPSQRVLHRDEVRWRGNFHDLYFLIHLENSSQ